jgi:tRNA modification GTPase
MTAPDHDTIAAVATPPGRGGVGIVRVSGPRAAAVARGILGTVPRPRRAVHRPFLDDAGAVIDTGIALYFPGPGSFTGEDVVELHGHGGPVVMDMLLQRTLQLGARQSRPGEFSLRAFLNDKIDLAQAEAIADLIDSASQAAARSATRSLQGVFSQRIRDLVEELTQLRMYVEAAIDFPEEEIDFLSDGRIAGWLQAVIERLAAVQAAARQGTLLREGMTVVIAGCPNAGKSSLLNALACRDAAIVTDVPGTTRDLLREYISIDGMPLHVVDTAGLRDDPDPVESKGIERAWNAIDRADRVLLVIDDQRGMDSAVQAITQRLPPSVPVTHVYNKIDLTSRPPGVQEGDPPRIGISAKNGAGMEALCRHLTDSMGYHTSGEGAFIARRRHLEALERAAAFLEQGRSQLQENGAGDLLANDLYYAQQALGEITGEFTSDDLLGRIFSEFCIGK